MLCALCTVNLHEFCALLKHGSTTNWKMQFSVITQAFMVFVILTQGLIVEAKYNTSRMAKSKDTNATFEKRQAQNHTRVQPGQYYPSKGTFFTAAGSSKGKSSPAAKLSAKKPSNRKLGSYGRSNPNYFEPDANSSAETGFEDAGAFHHAGGMQRAETIDYQRKNNRPSSSAEELYVDMRHNEGMEDIPNNRCSDEMDANAQDMFSQIHTISSNVESLLQFVEEASNRQSQLQSWMDTYDTRLLAIDQKLDQFLSEHESASESIRQAVQSAEETTSALTQLTDSEHSNTQVFEGAYYTSDALNETLTHILNTLSTIYNEESLVLSQMLVATSSIAQDVNSIYLELKSGGGNPITVEEMQDNLERLRRSIVNAFRTEIASIVQYLNSLNSQVSNVGSLGEKLGTSLDSLYSLGTSLTSITQMVTEIRERVFIGCKIHVKGRAGKDVELSQGERAEILRQEMKKHKEANQIKNAEEIENTWKSDELSNPHESQKNQKLKK